MFFAGIYFIVELALLQVYPAYVCFKSIKGDQQQQFRSLLIYWVVATCYLAVEQLTNLLLFWLPLYYEAKFVVLLWLILPQTQGTEVVYTKYLDPFLTKHESGIDKTLIEIQARMKDSMLQYAKQFVDQVRRIISDSLFKSTDTHPSTPPAAPTTESNSWTISPYTIFSSLMNTSAIRSLEEEQSEQQQYEGSLSADDSSDGVKVERSDSSSPQSSAILNNNDASQSESWGKYMASWVWKSPTKKQD